MHVWYRSISLVEINSSTHHYRVSNIIVQSYYAEFAQS